jgi:hypothetical protein
MISDHVARSGIRRPARSLTDAVPVYNHQWVAQMQSLSRMDSTSPHCLWRIQHSSWIIPVVSPWSLVATGPQPYSEARSHREIPYRNVIGAGFDTNTRVLNVTYLYKKKKNPFQLFVAEGQVQDTELSETTEWVEALLNTSYAGNCFTLFARALQ